MPLLSSPRLIGFENTSFFNQRTTRSEDVTSHFFLVASEMGSLLAAPILFFHSLNFTARNMKVIALIIKTSTSCLANW